MKINYFGKPYSFTHVVALRRFGKEHEYNPIPTIDKTIEAVIGVPDSISVVPIENSICGVVDDTIDILCTDYLNSSLNILEELELQIRLFLLSKNSIKLSQIKKIYSHEYPLKISRGWIEKNIPKTVSLEQVVSTSEGIHRIQKEEGSCAIASSEAAEHYDLEKISEIKVDGIKNLTRFFVMASS